MISLPKTASISDQLNENYIQGYVIDSAITRKSLNS